MSQLKFSFEHGYKKSQELGVTQQCQGGQTQLRGHTLRLSQMRHICHLAAWGLKHERFDLFKPWHLRHAPAEMFTPKMRAGSSPQPCSIMISRGLIHKKKERKQGKNGKNGRKMAEPTVLRLGVWHSGSCGSFHLLSVLFKLTCRQLRMQGALLFFKALIPPCSSSVTFLKEQLYEHNHEYYHPGDLPDSSSLIVP